MALAGPVVMGKGLNLSARSEGLTHRDHSETEKARIGGATRAWEQVEAFGPDLHVHDRRDFCRAGAIRDHGAFSSPLQRAFQIRRVHDGVARNRVWTAVINH